MDDNHKFEPIPHFDPFLVTNAILGINNALLDMMGEVPARPPESTRYFDSLWGLAYAGRLFAEQLHAYLLAVDESGFDLPRDQEDFSEIKEQPALYAVR